MAYETIVPVGTLQKSAQTYQKDLIIMPVIAAKETLQHMTARPNTRGKRTVGQLGGDFEIAPYKSKRKSEGTFTITPRTLETFLGNAAKDFDPNDVWDTIYGSMVTRGESLKNVDIAKQILFYAAGLLGKKLNMSVWKAKRNENGDTTDTLFNGFDTITDTEIAAGNISAAKKNFMELEALTEQNAVDTLKSLYWASAAELQGERVKMYMSFDQYRLYLQDYQSTVGATPYNREYKKTFLEGSDGKCELVPLVSKSGSDFIHISPKSNMLYGYGNGSSSKEHIGIGKYASFVLTLEAAMYFGCEFESISPERLMVAKVAAAE